MCRIKVSTCRKFNGEMCVLCMHLTCLIYCICLIDVSITYLVRISDFTTCTSISNSWVRICLHTALNCFKFKFFFRMTHWWIINKTYIQLKLFSYFRYELITFLKIFIDNVSNFDGDPRFKCFYTQAIFRH